ncbi:MAG: chromate resistance protein [Gammaproteobacteria bacterium]|nr:chromate resistance protein [Gammaproteobacteria bacterium]
MNPSTPTAREWLLLLHQFPPKPAYLRVKVWRRLQALGAVAVKSAAYVLPDGEQAFEDFQWVRREIEEAGGEASVCRARFVDGLSDDQIEALFNAARDADYAQIAEEARAAIEALPAGEASVDARAQARRLRRRLEQVAALDFFAAEGRNAAEGLLGALEGRGAAESAPASPPATLSPADYRGRTWVTRAGIYVDRMASAWLVRRFVDPAARFKFVAGDDYRPRTGELRFDMYEGEFTHEGDRCTFEVLLERFRLADPSLGPIAEIVHDIDMKDGKFRREEAPGIAALLSGVRAGQPDDDARLAQAEAIFDGLYEQFSRQRRV